MKTDRNQRLSEHLLNVDEELLANAYEIDDAEKLKAYKKAKSAPVTLLHRRSVWMPVAAAAACVALAVGLWQGGVFAPAQLPVEPPTEGSTTEATEATEPTDTDVVTDPTDTTTKEPDADTTTAKPTTTTTTVKPTTTTVKPTTTTTTKTTTSKLTVTTTTVKPTTTKPTTKKEKPLITADEPANYFPAATPKSHSEKLIHSWLREKMEIYKDQDVLYAVIVEVPLLGDELNKLITLRNENEWESEEDWFEFYGESVSRIVKHNTEKLKEIIGEELIPVSSTEGKYWGVYAVDHRAFIMDLTAEEINELYECGCFFIRLRHPDGDGATSMTLSQ